MYPVYDIVLLPQQSVEENSIIVSRKLDQFGTEFTLQADKIFPHLSLYMVNLKMENIEKANQLLSEIANRTTFLKLETLYYTNDFTEGMFEITYKKNDTINRLQQDIITAINPLREGLRTKDPVGHILTDWLSKQEGEIRDNLEQYGYDEIGELFRPHITFTRFITRDTHVKISTLPLAKEFNGSFTKLGLFEMGENGTCIREISTFLLENIVNADVY